MSNITVISQLDLQSRREYIIYENEDQGGHTKTRNVPPNLIQRKSVHAGAKETDYRFCVDLYTCVHGWMDESKAQRASLIVFDAQFVCVKGKGLIRSTQISFEFNDYAGANPGSNPEVIAYAPFGSEETFDEATTDVRSRHQVEAGAGASMGASVDARYTREKESSYQMRYFGRGDSRRVINATQNRYTGVWWSLTKSQDPHDDQHGVRPNCRFALLLTRSSDANFTASFRLDVDAGFWYAVQKRFDRWKGTAETDDPINFSPAFPPQGEYEGIDPLRLGIWKNEDKLKRLTTF